MLPYLQSVLLYENLLPLVARRRRGENKKRPRNLHIAKVEPSYRAEDIFMSRLYSEDIHQFLMILGIY